MTARQAVSSFNHVRSTTFMRRITRFLVIALILWAHGAFATTLAAGVFRLSYDTADTADAERALHVLADATAEFESFLPVGEAPIQVYLCATHAEFRRHAGPLALVDVGGIANPHAGIIVVKTPDLVNDFDGVLRHELVHVLLARNVNTGRLPRWLNEGLSMHLSREHRWNTRFRIAQMYVNNQILSYPDLQLTLAAFPGEMQFGDAYAQSLSMTWFLERRLGRDGLWQLVRDLDDMTFLDALRHHTGWTPREFWEAWRSSLWVGSLIFMAVTGVSVFQVAALLLVAAWWRKRRRARAILDTWDDDDELMPWEISHEDPCPWEQDEED